MSKRIIYGLAVGLLAGFFVSSGSADACELFHTLIQKETPCVDPKDTLCWSGCPLRISNEQDEGKGRWIIKKKSGKNSVQQLITLEHNTDTGVEYVKQMKRTTEFFCVPEIPDAALQARVDDATSFPACGIPDFKLKGVKPRVCVDQTFNCPTKNQRSLAIWHDWDQVDDLGRGINAQSKGVTFKDSPNADLNVWFEVCCGEVKDFGQPGDYLSTDTYAVIGDPITKNCWVEKLRETARNKGGILPAPGEKPDCKKKK